MKQDPTPIDVLVGENIRICRLQRRLTQTELGQRIGVSFQQVQRYENGANRVGASRLTQVANALEVPLLSLFDGTTTRPNRQPDQSPRALLAKPYSLRLLQGSTKWAAMPHAPHCYSLSTAPTAGAICACAMARAWSHSMNRGIEISSTNNRKSINPTLIFKHFI